MAKKIETGLLWRHQKIDLFNVNIDFDFKLLDYRPSFINRDDLVVKGGVSMSRSSVVYLKLQKFENNKMAVHNSNAAKIQQNKLCIDCATSSNFVNNLIDLKRQNINVTIDACKNSDNPYKELFGTCEYVSCQ